MLSFKQITKNHTIINNSILKSILAIHPIVEEYHVSTKGGICIQRNELEQKLSDFRSMTEYESNDRINWIEIETEEKLVGDLKEETKKIDNIAKNAIHDLTTWIISYREIASDLRTVFYENRQVEEKIVDYNSIITKLNKLIVQYGDYARNFKLGEKQYTDAIVDIEKIRNSDKMGLLVTSDTYAQALIEKTRREMMMRSYIRLIQYIKNKVAIK